LTYPTLILPGAIWFAVAATGIVAWTVIPDDPSSEPKHEPGPAQATSDARKWFVLFMVSWTVLTIAAFYIKSKISTPIFNDRNLIVVTAPIILLAAAALNDTSMTITRTMLVRLAMVCSLGLYLLVGGEKYYHTQSKEHFRQAAKAALEATSSLRDVAVVTLTYGSYYTYYFHKLNAPLAIDESVSKSRLVPVAAQHAWKRNAGHLLVLWGHQKFSAGDRAKLVRGHEVVSAKNFRGAGYILLRR
jgi:hypothetical protein